MRYRARLPMRALVFDLSIPKYLVARAAGPKHRRLFLGAGSCTSLRDVADPRPHDGTWATVAPQLVGVCGTDLATVFFKLSPVLSALSSSPSTLGHEIFARIDRLPLKARDATGAPIAEGDGVVIDPFASCAARGVDEADACASCRLGAYATCERAGTGPRLGMMLGAGVALPGGFASRTIAHESMLFRVQGRIKDDRVAALVEPLAVAVQAVSTHAPKSGRVLVIGGGPIGLGVAWALDRLCPDVEVTLVSLESFQLDHARRLGAEQAIAPPRGADVLELYADRLRSPLLRPVMGRPFLAGGFDAVFDCVGLPGTLDDALRCTRPRGTVVMAGCHAVIPKLDMTFVWSRELRLVGTLAYGWCDDDAGKRVRTFPRTIDLVADDEAKLRPLVTHELPLERYREAFDLTLDRRANQSVKVLLRPNG
jgi:threonine dehydrogenase-like Zn-dependent dehydrogenase